VLDLLARHPGTARHLCRKIATRLLADAPPPDLIDRLTATWLAHADAPDQIAQVVRTLALDPAFDAPPAKLRRPFEFLAALYRATGAEVIASGNDWHWHLARAGWQQHTYPPPNGPSDQTADWATGNTLRRLTDLALNAHKEWFATATARPTLPPDIAHFGGAAAHWSRALHGTPMDPLPEFLAAAGLAPQDRLPADPTERADLSTAMLAFAALSPQFMFR